MTLDEFKKVAEYKRKYGKTPDLAGRSLKNFEAAINRGKISPFKRTKGTPKKRTLEEMYGEFSGGVPFLSVGTDAQAEKLMELAEKRWVENRVRDHISLSDGEIRIAPVRKEILAMRKSGAITDRLARRWVRRLHIEQRKEDVSKMKMETMTLNLARKSQMMMDEETLHRFQDHYRRVDDGEESVLDLPDPTGPEMKGTGVHSPGRRMKVMMYNDRKYKEVVRSVWDPKEIYGVGSNREIRPMPMDVPYASQYTAAIYEAAARRYKEETGGSFGGLDVPSRRATVRRYVGLKNKAGGAVMRTAGRAGIGPDVLAGALVHKDKNKLGAGALSRLRDPGAARGLNKDDVEAFRSHFGIEPPKAPVKPGRWEKFKTWLFGGGEEKGRSGEGRTGDRNAE